jgi:hypothetical protein
MKKNSLGVGPHYIFGTCNHTTTTTRDITSPSYKEEADYYGKKLLQTKAEDVERA